MRRTEGLVALLIFLLVTGFMLFNWFQEAEAIERTQTGVITVSAEVINRYDPVSTPEEPQQSAEVEEVYQPVIVEHQRDLTAIELGCVNGDSIPEEKCER